MSKMQQGMCEVEEKLKRQLLSEVHSHRTSALEARLQVNFTVYLNSPGIN